MTSPTNKPSEILGTPVQPKSGPNLTSEQRDVLREYHLVNEWNTEDGTSVAEVARTPTKAILEAHDLELQLGELLYVYEKPNGDTIKIHEYGVIDSGIVFHTSPDCMLRFAHEKVEDDTWEEKQTPTA
jgi:hypothetical protein